MGWDGNLRLEICAVFVGYAYSKKVEGMFNTWIEIEDFSDLSIVCHSRHLSVVEMISDRLNLGEGATPRAALRLSLHPPFPSPSRTPEEHSCMLFLS